MNKATLVGRLGADPEVRFMPDGRPVARVRMATDTFYKDKNGNRTKKVEWHRVNMYGSLAETASDYLKKGRLILIEGTINTRKWTDKEGIERYTTEINARNMEFLDSSISKDNGSKEAAETEAPLPNDDVPF